MKYGLTIAYITSRNEPHFDWMIQSLIPQLYSNEKVDVLVIDGLFSEAREQQFMSAAVLPSNVTVNVYPVKPNIWQGKYKVTKEEAWAKANSLNTSLTLCKNDFWSFVDDRCVLGSGWLQAVREAQDADYACCGGYEKCQNMRVKDGIIEDYGKLLGVDTRLPGRYPFDSFYGGSGALPLEWALNVGGFAELTEGTGLEDSMFGSVLKNNGYPIYYDSTMRLIEDRTPGKIDGAFKRRDKGESPQDRSHQIVYRLENSKDSLNDYNLRELRESVLKGEPFPIPGPGPHRDWYDDQLISEML